MLSIPMSFKRSFFLTLAFGICLTLGFAAGYLTRDRWLQPREDFQIFNQAYDILRNQGLKPVPSPPAIEYGMIRGMLQAYADPYTIFVEPAQHELESDALQGSFGGIGVRLNRDAQGNVILYPYPGSPASSAGILEGDHLVSVDDLTITGDVSLETIQASLRGPVGRYVRVAVMRPPDTTTWQFSIRRAEIPLPSVAWHVDADSPKLGIIEINIIAASTAGEVRRAIDDLKTRQVSALVIDLRNNFGGLLTAGVDIARLFLKDGEIIQHQFRDREVEVYRVEHPGPYIDIPLAILVNENTASAAEIIAGALKVHGRAQIVGTPTYGKDTIQLVFDLQDKSSLHITAAHWWVPGLEPAIGSGGLQPDILVTPSADNAGPDPFVLAAAAALLRSK